MRCNSCNATFPESHTYCLICKQDGSDPSFPLPSYPVYPGPGTKLHDIIPWFFQSKGCKCKSFVAKMDQWGTIGCQDRFDRIVRYLTVKGKKHWATQNLPIALVKHQATAWIREVLRPIDNGQWYIAITSSPRKIPTVGTCIDSLRFAGWEPVVFAEPETPRPSCSSCLTYTHPTQLGIWHNWLHSCKVALESPAPYILTVQDDSLFHPDSRKFIEKVIADGFPEDAGAISLYTASHYVRKAIEPSGLIRLKTSNYWGSCAMVWERQTLEKVINHPLVSTWLGAPCKSPKRKEIYKKRQANPHLIMNSDTAMSRILFRMKKKIYCFTPSPVSHIARFSSVKHGGNTGKRNCNPCADHSIPLEEQIKWKLP